MPLILMQFKISDKRVQPGRQLRLIRLRERTGWFLAGRMSHGSTARISRTSEILSLTMAVCLGLYCFATVHPFSHPLFIFLPSVYCTLKLFKGYRYAFIGSNSIKIVSCLRKRLQRKHLLLKTELFSFEAGSLSVGTWCTRKQRGSHKSCLSC